MEAVVGLEYQGPGQQRSVRVLPERQPGWIERDHLYRIMNEQDGEENSRIPFLDERKREGGIAAILYL